MPTSFRIKIYSWMQSKTRGVVSRYSLNNPRTIPKHFYCLLARRVVFEFRNFFPVRPLRSIRNCCCPPKDRTVSRVDLIRDELAG